jgi:hypothetical protein
VPTIDDEASLAAFVDGNLVAATMIRVDRPGGRVHNNLTSSFAAGEGGRDPAQPVSLIRLTHSPA